MLPQSINGVELENGLKTPHYLLKKTLGSRASGLLVKKTVGPRASGLSELVMESSSAILYHITQTVYIHYV